MACTVSHFAIVFFPIKNDTEFKVTAKKEYIVNIFDQNIDGRYSNKSKWSGERKATVGGKKRDNAICHLKWTCMQETPPTWK